MRQLHPLGSTSRTRGINQSKQILWLDLRHAGFDVSVSIRTQFLPPRNKIVKPKHPFWRLRFRIHQNQMRYLFQLRHDANNAIKQTGVLHEDDFRIGMLKDVFDFLIRDISPARNIGSAAHQNRIIHNIPLHTIISQQSHMITSLNTELNQSRSKKKTEIVEISIAHRLEDTFSDPRCKRRLIAITFCC